MEQTPRISAVKKINTITGLLGNKKTDFSQDISLIIGIDSNGILNIYDIQKKEIIRRYSNLCYFPECADFSPDGKLFASKKSTSPSSLHIWSLEDRNLCNVFEGHTGHINSVCFTSNETIISLANINLSTSYKIEIKIWNITKGTCISTFLESSLFMAKKLFSSPDGTILIIVYPKKVSIWSSVTGEIISTIEGLYDNIERISFSGDSSKIATINRKNRIKIWNTRDGKKIKELITQCNVKDLIFLPEGKEIMYTCGNETKGKIIDIKTGENISEFELGENFKEITGMSLSPEGRYLVSQGIGDTEQTCIYEIKWEGESSKIFSDFDNFFATGKFFLKDGFPEKAEECFQKALSIKGSEENEELQNNLKIAIKRIEVKEAINKGELLLKEHSYKKAEEVYRELSNIKEIDRRTKFSILDRLEDIKLLTGFTEFSEKFTISDIKPIYDPALPYGNYFIINKKNLHKFLNIIKKISSAVELTSEQWNIIGYIYSAGSQFYQALEAFHKAHMLEPNNKGYHRNYAWALYYAGDYNSSIYELNRLHIDREDEDITIDLCIAMTGKVNNFEQTVDMLTKVLEKNPSSLRANLYLGELLTGINDFFPTFFNTRPDKKRAKKFLIKANELRPDLLRIKSSLDYTDKNLFPLITEKTWEKYTDYDFFKEIYDKSPRGRNWSLKDTYTKNHSSNIKYIEFSRDGSMFITLGEENLFYHTYEDRQWIPRELKSYCKEKINCAAISATKEYIATAGETDIITLWHNKDGEYIFAKTWRALQSKMNALIFSRKRGYLFSCAKNEHMRMWDIQTGLCLKVFKGHTSSIMEIDISSDEYRAVTASRDRSVRLWDINTGECIRIFEFQKEVKSVKFCPDNNYIITGDTGGEIKIWDINTGECIKTIPLNTGSINRISFFPDGHFAFFCTSEVIAWNLLKDSKEIFEFTSKNITNISVSPTGNFLVTGNNKGVIKTWQKSVVCEQNYLYYLIKDKNEVEKFNELCKNQDESIEENNKAEIEYKDTNITNVEYKENEGIWKKTWNNFFNFLKR